MISSENNLREPARGPDKKTYSKPQLQIYGDLKAITGNVDGFMASDGGGNQNNGKNRTS